MKTNKTIWLTGVGMICLPTLVCAKQNVQQPNILFILCDDMVSHIRGGQPVYYYMISVE